MTLSLEQEFEKRKQEVMRNVVSAVTMKAYMDKELSGVNIPTFLVDKGELQYRASVVADKVLAQLIKEDALEKAFNEAWEVVAPLI